MQSCCNRANAIDYLNRTAVSLCSLVVFNDYKEIEGENYGVLSGS
jgi:hypothetical protein